MLTYSCPPFQYDRAGRSTGLAFVTYSSVADATLAKDKLDGQRANVRLYVLRRLTQAATNQHPLLPFLFLLFAHAAPVHI